MPTVTQVEDALRPWVLGALVGSPAEGNVIFSAQGRARPARPYADIDLATIEQRGRDERRGVDEDGIREVVGQRAVRVTIQLYGDDAMELAERVRSDLWLETVTDPLRAAGIAFWSAEPVLDLTTEIETALEPRAAFEALFGIARAKSEDVGFINCVEGTATYLAPDGSTAIEYDYEACGPSEFLTVDNVPVTVDGDPITVN
jgi:hypothetical protein